MFIKSSKLVKNHQHLTNKKLTVSKGHTLGTIPIGKRMNSLAPSLTKFCKISLLAVFLSACGSTDYKTDQPHVAKTVKGNYQTLSYCIGNELEKSIQNRMNYSNWPYRRRVAELNKLTSVHWSDQKSMYIDFRRFGKSMINYIVRDAGEGKSLVEFRVAIDMFYNFSSGEGSEGWQRVVDCSSL